MRIISILISSGSSIIVFLIARQYVEKKYALLASAFFILEPNLIENSTYAITEPLFILLGLISFYFVINKNERYLLLSFLFAGLAFETRLNGIVLFLLTLLVAAYRLKPKTRLIKTIIIGTIIFLAVSFPYVYSDISLHKTPFLSWFEGVKNTVSSNQINPQLAQPAGNLFKSENGTPISGISHNQNALEIFKSAIFKEIVHIFRISVPYLIFFVPFGIIAALKNLDFNKKTLFYAILISLIIAIPQYTISAVFRNLFFITPFFSILSVIGIQNISQRVDLNNIYLVLLVGGLFVSSFYFLYEEMPDHELIKEKESFAKYVASNFKGAIAGHDIDYVRIFMIDLSSNHINFTSNGKITLTNPSYPLYSKDSLMTFVTQNNIQYIIVDNEIDNRFSIFPDIYYHEQKYPQLKKVFDSQDNGYNKYMVKIFEVNHI